VPFDGGNLRRLVLEGVQAVHITNHRLDGCHQQRHPQRHGKHFAYRWRVVALQQVPGSGSADKHGATQESGHRHMQQPVRE